MSDQPTRPATFAFRMTLEECAELGRAADAAGISRGDYVHGRVFSAEITPPRSRSRGKFPVKDHQALSAVLGKLGQSRLASNLNQLAKAAHSGSLLVSPEIEAELRGALAEIAAMRALLVTALGLSEDRSSSGAQ